MRSLKSVVSGINFRYGHSTGTEEWRVGENGVVEITLSKNYIAEVRFKDGTYFILRHVQIFELV